jgi:hypothetical protein
MELLEPMRLERDLWLNIEQECGNEQSSIL